MNDEDLIVYLAKLNGCKVIWKLIKAWFQNHKCSRARYELYHVKDMDAVDRRQCNIVDGRFFRAIMMKD